MMKKIKKLKIDENNKGITMIALVVTIIVLLILAGISISMLSGNNGLLKRATEAKENTIIGQEQEQVELAYLSAAVKKLGGNVERDDLQEELDISVGEGKTTVTGNSLLKVKFEDTKHEYQVTTTGQVSKLDSDGNNETWTYNHSAQTVTNGTLTLNIGDYIIDTENTTTDFDGHWRIIGVENGKLKLTTAITSAPFLASTISSYAGTSKNENNLILSGTDGYYNGKNALNAIGATYNNTRLENGRSINVDDINILTGYNPNNVGVDDPDQTGTGTKAYNYGTTVTYKMIDGKVNYSTDGENFTQTSGTVYKKFGSAINMTDGETDTWINSSYYYDLYDYSFINNRVKNVVNGDAYWLASPCVKPSWNGVDWAYFCIAFGTTVTSGFTLNSLGTMDNYGNCVRTVVSLKSNILPEYVADLDGTEFKIYKIGNNEFNIDSVGHENEM